ncbi:MAG: elongation factor P [bacterium]|nr:elongation factor P [bacterium]
MIIAAELKHGTTLRIDNELYRVLEVEHKSGTAQFAGFIHAKLRKLSTGAELDRKFHQNDKLDDVELETRQFEYLYATEEEYYFMDPETYEQVSLRKELLGKFAEKFLKEGMKLPIQLYEGNPVGVILPELVEVKVVSTAAGIRGESDATYKSATLENGMEILVPQFIKVGDIVKVSSHTGKYVERVTKK